MFEMYEIMIGEIEFDIEVQKNESEPRSPRVQKQESHILPKLNPMIF